MKKYYLRLDIVKEVDTEYIEVIQQDTLVHEFYITLMNNGTLLPIENVTFVQVTIDKPDSTQWVSTAEVLDKGQVRFDLEYQAIAAVGIATITLKIYTGESILTTPSFSINVISDPNAGTSGSIISASEYPILTQLVTGYENSLFDITKFTELSGINNYTVVPTYYTNKLVKVEEYDGETLKRQIDVTYTDDDKIATITDMVEGKTFIETINYSYDSISSITKQILDTGL